MDTNHIDVLDIHEIRDKSQWYPSATGTIPLVNKSNRITFKNSPLFLRLLDGLIQKGMGVPKKR